MRFLPALVAASLVFAVHARASAFCRTTSNGSFVPTAAKPCDDQGDPLFWASSCVGFDVQRSASVQVDLTTARQIVADSFAQWSGVSCLSTLGETCSGAATGKPNVSAKDLGPIDCGEVEYVTHGPNANVIVFRDGVWPNEGIALALTTVTYKINGGEIYDADIEVQSNPAQVKLGVTDPIAADAYDLRSILTHEVGHFLGLAHTQPANAASTMYERYRAGQTFMRDIAPDDECGICNAYPSTRKATCDATPQGGLGNLCNGADAKSSGCSCAMPGHGASEGEVFSGALAVVGLALVWATRRRRT